MVSSILSCIVDWLYILGGKWTIVNGVAVSDFSREKLVATANELEEERKMAFEFLNIA